MQGGHSLYSFHSVGEDGNTKGLKDPDVFSPSELENRCCVAVVLALLALFALLALRWCCCCCYPPSSVLQLLTSPLLRTTAFTQDLIAAGGVAGFHVHPHRPGHGYYGSIEVTPAANISVAPCL